MKKSLFLVLMVLGVFSLVSCSDSADTLSASKAEKLVKKELKRLNKLESYESVQIGYFECADNDARYKLRQLAANEIMTYKCDKVMKKDRVRKSRTVRRQGWWGAYNDTEYYYEDVDVPCYFVTTALTEKGQKLVYEEKEIEPSADVKELRLDEEVDLSKYPESKVDAQEFPEQAKEAEAQPAEEEVVAEDEFQPDEEVPAEEVDVNNASARSAYEIAKDKENSEYVLLKACVVDIVKARNIMKTGDFSAKAEILFEYDVVTPVGRIYSSVYEGQRFLSSGFTFAFYQDKGWKLEGGDE